MIKKLLSLCCLFFLIPVAIAVNVSSLYQVNLPVTSQHIDERNQAIKKGLQEVLIKLAGESNIINSPVGQMMVEKPQQYVEEFSYTSPTNITIRYNKQDINRLLKKANIAYWGENRPLILIWMAFTNGQHDTVILGNDTNEIPLESMEQEGKRYGLPIIFPVMDMADLSQVTPQVIDTMDIESLKEASKRYSPDGMLIGKVNQLSANQINSDWQLVLANQEWNWQITESSINAIFSAALKQANLLLAKHYTVKTTSSITQSVMKLQISSVSGGEEVERIIHFLKQLTNVQKVELSQIAGDTVELTVLIRGPITAFQDNAALSQHLILKIFDEKNQKWLYEWIR